LANTRTANVIYVDTTAAFAGPLSICGIKYIGAATGTVVITATDSGSNLWQESGTNNLPMDEAEIVAQGGITVTVANSAKCYIYLED
jgi:hypothetical protein